MSEDKRSRNRRDLIAAAATGAAGLAMAGAAAGQPRPTRLQSRALNPNAKAVLPDGRKLDRAAVLSQLGLDPTTPPDAWLAIVACGSNASALKAGELRTLVNRGALKANELDAASRAKIGN